ncbi:sigma-70 family RNA polymerase sigma factor [Solwaraspora sp. WMMB762]|uniref:sigma-70 family RNA polymerase sigma factor n=1 Tax=Solwaraspora sp. WMMB762 TaxID=3404120 RepID=UPI003B92C6D4
MFVPIMVPLVIEEANVMAMVRSAARQTRRESTNVNKAHVDELRAILEQHGAEQARNLVGNFANRHQISHHDVDALLNGLTRGPEERPAGVEPGGPAAGDLDLDHGPVEPVGLAEMSTDDDALDWMFADEPPLPAPRPASDVVGRALDDLLGDWERKGGQLTRDEVSRLAVQRKLSLVQHGELLDRLAEAGVELPVAAGARPIKAKSDAAVTRGDGDAVRLYIRQIGRYPLINAVREVELWSSISQGVAAQQRLDDADQTGLTPGLRQRLQEQAVEGRRAHAELVCANLRLVVSIAKLKQYEGCGVEFADRIQDGNTGLMRAADKFDGSKGFKFSTYASWWIRQAIDRGIGDRGRTIRIPVHMYEKLRRVRAIKLKLADRFGREPTLSEMCERTGLEPGQAQAALDLLQPVRSIDQLIGEDGDFRLSDVLAVDGERDGRADPAEIVMYSVFQAEIARAVKIVLRPREVEIIRRRFGIGNGEEETLDRIGVHFNITRERIRQLLGKSLAKLRESPDVQSLRSYLIDDSRAGADGASAGRWAS